ncbi:DUF4192 family protein [Microbacterium soli]
MNTVIHAAEPAELLGTVPVLAGFTPRRSVVLLPFHGTRGRGAMRIDLPDPGGDPHTFASAALQALLQVDDVDATAIVVYSDAPPQSDADRLLPPWAALAEALVEACEGSGLRIIEAMWVTPTGWGDYLDEDAVPRPLDSIPSAPDIPGVGDLSGDQLAGADLPASDLADRERVGRALAELETIMDGHRDGRAGDAGDENPLALMGAAMILDDLPAFVEDLLEAPTRTDSYSCAALLWCLSRPVLRDAILVQWASDEEFGCRALAAQLAFTGQHSELPDEIGDVFTGRGARPDPDRLGCALEVVRHAAARAPRPAKAGALTAAAWLAWALGRSSHAGRYVDEALRIDPGLGMATLIRSMLDAARLPEWVLRRP